MSKLLALVVVSLFGLSVVGCSSDDEATSASTSEPSATSTVTSPGDQPEPSESQPTADLPSFMTLPITDVDGMTFTLQDFAGTPLYVQNFATWCSTCLKQLPKTDDAAASLGDSAVFLALSVETDLDSADVAAYADDNGFDSIRFAVMSPEMLAAMVEYFDNSSVNPPSTPHFIVGFDLTVSDLMTGAKSSDDIVAAVSAVA